jgi:hypothetical protein
LGALESGDAAKTAFPVLFRVSLISISLGPEQSEIERARLLIKTGRVVLPACRDVGREDLLGGETSPAEFFTSGSAMPRSISKSSRVLR